jgi:hypothetical protein
MPVHTAFKDASCPSIRHSRTHHAGSYDIQGHIMPVPVTITAYMLHRSGMFVISRILPCLTLYFQPSPPFHASTVGQMK